MFVDVRPAKVYVACAREQACVDIHVVMLVGGSVWCVCVCVCVRNMYVCIYLCANTHVVAYLRNLDRECLIHACLGHNRKNSSRLMHRLVC